MSYRTLKRVYLILAGAAFLMFFGHGAWAGFENSEKFRGLASDSLNNLFGTSTNVQDWAISTAGRTAGWRDITISLVMTSTPPPVQPRWSPSCLVELGPPVHALGWR